MIMISTNGYGTYFQVENKISHAVDIQVTIPFKISVPLGQEEAPPAPLTSYTIPKNDFSFQNIMALLKAIYPESVFANLEKGITEPFPEELISDQLYTPFDMQEKLKRNGLLESFISAGLERSTTYLSPSSKITPTGFWITSRLTDRASYGFCHHGPYFWHTLEIVVTTTFALSLDADKETVLGLVLPEQRTGSAEWNSDVCYYFNRKGIFHDEKSSYKGTIEQFNLLTGELIQRGNIRIL